LAVGNYPLPMPTEYELELLIRCDPFGHLQRFPSRFLTNWFLSTIFNFLNLICNYKVRKRMRDFSVSILQLISYFNDVFRKNFQMTKVFLTIIIQIWIYLFKPSPNLTPRLFTSATIEFIDICLQKNPANRKDYRTLKVN